MEAIWHRVTIDNPVLTQGKALSDFLNEILQAEGSARFVIVAGVEGGGDPILGITQIGCIQLSKQELLKRLLATDQVDWGNLFFTAEQDENLVNMICSGLSVIEAISKSILTVRVIDDTSLDIFLSNSNFSAHLVALYPSAQCQSSQLSEMDFPT